MTRLKNKLLCCLLALPAAACGLKGPLYLPGDAGGPPPSVDAGETKQDEDERKAAQDEGHGSHP